MFHERKFMQRNVMICCNGLLDLNIVLFVVSTDENLCFTPFVMYQFRKYQSFGTKTLNATRFRIMIFLP